MVKKFTFKGNSIVAGLSLFTFLFGFNSNMKAGNNNSFDCPTAITVNVDQGACTATLDLGTLNLFDPSEVNSFSNDAPSSFNIGTTLVNWEFSLINESTEFCQQEVIVVDSENPTITCPSNVTVNNLPGLCSATPALGLPIVGDNCGTPTFSNNAPTSFNVGSTEIIWTAIDASGNMESCPQTIVVIDNELPVVICPPVESDHYIDEASCFATINLVAPSVLDNCGVASIVNNAPPMYNPGNRTIIWTVTDINGNARTCSQIVHVIDNQLPTIECPADIDLVTEPGFCVPSSIEFGIPVVTDNCSISSIVNDYSSNFSIGSNTLVWTVSDNFGNSASCSQIVTIVDSENPTINCPSDISVSTNSGVCIASNLDLGLPVVADNCTVDSYTNDAPSEFSIGTTVINWSVLDASGNSASCYQNITVSDNEAPVASAQDITLELDANLTATATAAAVNNGSSDNCGIASIAISGTTTFDCSNVGNSYTVTLTVTDIHGNSSSTTSQVTIAANNFSCVTNHPPVAVCKNITIGATANCQANASASDVNNGSSDEDGDILTYTLSPAGPYSLGNTNVTLTVTDPSGLSSSCSSVITVVDNTAPIANCKPSTIQLDANGNATLAVADINNGSSDNCSVASISISKSNFDCSNLGANNVDLTVVDAAGLSSTCTAVVTVVDNIAPVAICKSATVALTCGNATITSAMINNGSTDNCGIASITISPSSFTSANIGANTVTLTVTDNSGNVSTCTSTVTVTGTPLTCSIINNNNNCGSNNSSNVIYLGYGNQSIALRCNASGANGYSYSWSGASGLSGSGRNRTFTPTAAGTYTITCTVTGTGGSSNYGYGNGCGNNNNNNNSGPNVGCTSTCTYTVCVLDIRVPNTGWNSYGCGSNNNRKVYMCRTTNSGTCTYSVPLNQVSCYLNNPQYRLGSCSQSCGGSSNRVASNGNSNEELTEESAVEVVAAAELEFSVFPNPSANEYNFTFMSGSNELSFVQVFNMEGKEVYRQDNLAPNERITFGSDFAKGIYQLKITQGNTTKTSRIVKTSN